MKRIDCPLDIFFRVNTFFCGGKGYLRPSTPNVSSLCAHLEVDDVVLLEGAKHLDLTQSRLADDLVVIALLHDTRATHDGTHGVLVRVRCWWGVCGCLPPLLARRRRKKNETKNGGRGERKVWQKIKCVLLLPLLHLRLRRVFKRVTMGEGGGRGVGGRGRERVRRTLNFFTATISPVSLLRHFNTTPYAPSPTTPTTSYLFIFNVYSPLPFSASLPPVPLPREVGEPSTLHSPRTRTHTRTLLPVSELLHKSTSGVRARHRFVAGGGVLLQF